jgi:AAA family ATP:ADP antiporter
MQPRTDVTEQAVRLVGSALSRAFHVPVHDLARVLFHAAILCFILCGFWLLDALKDPVLAAIVGIEYQPIAKLLSVLVTFFVVCFYDYLTSAVSKSSLFHIISFTFGTLFFVIAALLSDSSRGLDNHVKSPTRILGWLSYFAIEAYGSLMVALFWSFTNSIMDLEQAKGAYGLIISFAQVGAILGSTLATQSVEMGIAQLYLFGSISVFLVSIFIKLYHIVFRDQVSVDMERTRVRSTTESSIDTDPLQPDPPSLSERLSVMFEGVTLIYEHRYVLYLLLVTCLYEIVITILDYEFKVMGAQYASGTHTPSSVGKEEDDETGVESSTGEGDANFVNLLGHFGQMTNVLSLVVATVGFSFLVRTLGVRYTLLIFPVIMFSAVVLTNLVPSFWLLFAMVSVLKACDYSLYDPVIELLYIPTSEPIKFKAKAWIDVFGARLAKAVGSVITHLANGNVRKLRTIAEMPMIVISLMLIGAAVIVGRDFEQLVRDDVVVGEDPAEAALRKLNHKYDHTNYRNGVSTEMLPTRRGLNPGDVGYDGYDLALYTEDVDLFTDDDSH